ncbi:alanine--tRNA ligase [Rhabdothermincola salaria]|uniref:alanine--tRNA ligase n=1 Tax=Rhabdothermincola salaria TaxID=2903142 RepID=UPI001E4E9F99|nr:alanine--tRNA ligase [Rhabdothermincola salaria]MCD9623211.1 alanine--tRNA ligase [Rhabdothermincola salaria]
MTANELRRAFLGFFEERGHTVVPSASLIPHDPDLMFTVAGMVPFKPYFLGEEQPPYRRATTVQKCVRAGGKDSDLEEVGRDTRHLSFFEMLGNFSFGDYFKSEAIPMAWEMVTELFGLDPDRLWVTVHLTDDEAEGIWRDTVGVRPDRIQRLDADNWWGPPGGPPGPCGPCSEIYVDKGPAYGPDGGPATGGDERYLEIWNLVFMQFARDADGVDTELPRKNIDTGAGFERILSVLQGVDSVFDTDVMVPLVDEAQRLTGVRLGATDRSDISLRILAEHARTMSFLVSDGVFPSNEGRGYVLRRIIRRAVREAYLLDVAHLVTPDLVDTTVAVMGEAYPDLVAQHDFVRQVVAREEERFRATLATGTTLLDAELDKLGAGAPIGGSVAFLLHDTHGFPLELTREIALERGHDVDQAGFDAEMAEQRRRAKEARKGGEGTSDEWVELAEAVGPTDFVGHENDECQARLLAVTDDSLVLDRTPFYAESGGQVGDTGWITSDTGRAEVLDTVYGATGLVRHRIGPIEGALEVGQEVTAAIDADRRNAIRRNHTGTHLLHWALREVLGDHVKQQGSQVAPDRLRFDFSHYAPLSAEETARIEDLVAAEVLANPPARHYETTKEYAEQIGAIAFFGDKYGDVVKVLEAGPRSVELCGGTHVKALGDIGPMKIVSEASIGSNIRRIEAVTGTGPLERLRADEARIAAVTNLLGVANDELVESVERRMAEVKELRARVRELERAAASGRAGELAEDAVDGIVVARVDGLDRDTLRDLAVATRDVPGIRGVVLGSAPDGGGVAMVSAVRADSGLHASELIADAARTVKGGTGKNAELAVAGGKDPGALDEALDQVRSAAGLA